MLSSSPPPTQEHLQLIYQELKEQLRLQIDDLDTLDRKSTVLLAPIGLLIGFAFTAAAQLQMNLGAAITFSLGIASLVAGLVYGIFALWPRATSVAPNPTGLFPKYATRPTMDMLATECSTLVDVYRINQRVRKSKNPFLYAQFVALLLGTLGVAFAFAIVVGGRL